MPKDIVTIISENDKNLETLETWGTLTRACESRNTFKYHSIKMEKFPFKHAGFIFQKTKHNQSKK